MSMENKGKMTGNETIDTTYQYNTDNEYNYSNNKNQTNLPRDDLMLIENGNNTTSSHHTTTSNNDDGCTINYESHTINSDDDNSDNEEKQMYPSDCYSFLSLYGPIQNPVFFFFGLFICLFQLAFLSLFVLSVLHKKLSSNGEVDNPDDGLLAQFVHSDADPLVRATQILAIISYSLFAESSLQDVVTAVETFPRFDTATNDDKTRRVIFSCIFRFIQGGMAIFSSFVLVVNSSNVIEIILNFTAVNFISNIDDVAFLLASSGRYGSKLEEGAKSIENHPLPECMSRSTKNRRFCYTIMFTLLLMLAFIFAIIYAQVSDNFWRTTTFRVEFQGAFQSYTGCYNLHTSQDSRGLLEKKRKIYMNSNEAGAVEFGYCREDRRWFMYEGNVTDVCLAGIQKLAQSSRTQSFDISTSFEDTWTSVSGSPLDVFFFADLEDKNQCDSFGNGICDDVLNIIGIYDDGDCCAATCSQPSCGTGNFTEAFGVTLNTSGVVGFSDCIDPSMVPITIHVQDFVSSVEPQFFLSQWESYDWGYNADFRKNLTSKFGDLEGIRGNFNEFITWMNEFESGIESDYTWSKNDSSYILSDPIAPRLSLYCDQNNVLSILMDKSMEDNSETVMVGDGAECTLKIENTTDWDKSIWYFNYTIYHDEAMEVKIDGGSNFKDDTQDFIRIPDCFLDTIVDYSSDSQTILYNDLTRKFNWLAEHDTRNQPCSSKFSIERYALSIMNMPSIMPMINLTLPMINLTSNVIDDSKLWMNDNRHCMWPSVECSQGFVVGLDLTKVDGISGYTIPTEIGILTNLQTLDLSSTGLIGSIPTNVGLLTELTSLRLSRNELTGSIPMEIGLLTNLMILNLDYNNMTDSIQTEIGLLTNLTTLYLSDNELFGSIPTEVGLLTTLQWLDFSGNELSGTIPTEIGLLTDLIQLDLTDNELSGTIPTEVGLLTSLQYLYLDRNNFEGSIRFDSLTLLEILYLDKNKFKGSIPSELGLLTSLKTLGLGGNSLTSTVPSELGLLTSLKTLDLGGNALTSTVPSEIAQLANLNKISLANTDLTGTLPFSNLTAFETIYIYNSSMTTESIPTSLLVEPCTLCDDDGTFDYKETDNFTDLDVNKDDDYYPSYNCTEVIEQLDDRNSDNNWNAWGYSMLSIDECTDLKEQCIDCHLLV